ncbi:MAG: tail fiber domain-containing protein [Salinivirgaceae bacterium]
MRNKIIISILFVIAFTLNANSQIKVLNDGKVGIGNSNPTYKLDINGTTRFDNLTDVVLDWSGRWSNPNLYNVDQMQLEIGKQDNYINTVFSYNYWYIGGIYKSSDKRLKKDINKLHGSIDKISQINGMSYLYDLSLISKKFPTNIDKDLKRKQYGYLAQDFKEVFPDLVSQTTDSLGLYAIDYIGLIPVITEAIKEQQTIIAGLQSEIKLLKSGSGSLKSAQGTTDIISTSTSIASLSQNSPNPFDEKTEIGYYLPETTQNAMIYLYNMNGLQIKSIPIQSKGTGTLIIQGYELQPGMYIYTLIADGKEIDTKRMILTE